jgi:hypothetical protein
MLSFYFRLSNAKTRKFVVQCSHVENFFGFMFGILMRCHESNMWPIIEDPDLNAEFRSRVTLLTSQKAQLWIANNFEDVVLLKSYFALKTEKHGTNTCLIQDVRCFMNGWFGSQKPIKGLKDFAEGTSWSLHVFRTDVTKSRKVQVKTWTSNKDMVLTDEALFITAQTDFGRTSCCIAEL